MAARRGFQSHVIVNNSHRRLLAALTTLASRALLEVRKLDRQILYFFLLPALFFRFFPFILTHNSTPLSAYLAAALVYIPVKISVTGWQAYGSVVRGFQRAKVKENSSVMPMWNDPKESYLTTGKWTSNGFKKQPGALSISLWACGALFSIWVYVWGVASPFPTAANLIASSPTLTAHQARNATYYISAAFWNNEDILDAWTSETLKLIDTLGRHNVYVSLTENDSEDETPGKLRAFGRQLKERKIMHSVNITTGLRGEPPEDPWHSVQHRLGYMANLRNGALEPLGKLHKRFDVVVSLNDVVYHHTDVLKLIAAMGGDDLHHKNEQSQLTPKRRMACGLDMDNAALYDAWVLQDRCGRPITGFWPFFTSEEDKQSVRQGRVLEVGTCWNGITVLDGDMFLEAPLRSRDANWNAEPLRFQEPPKCIISECSLLPLIITNTTGGSPIVVDPTVVVAYSIRWWNYYAVWLRMPVVNLWMWVFEERYWSLWWNMGMGKGLRWTGLDDGKEKNECNVKGWPSCDSAAGAVKGGFRLKFKDEL